MPKEGINVRSLIHTVPMLRYAILIIIGIVIGDGLFGVISPREWIVMMSILVGAAILTTKKHPMASSILILASMVAFGAFRICWNETGAYDMNKEETGKRCKIAIISEPIVRGKVIQFDGIVVPSPSSREGKNHWLEGSKIRVSMLRDTITGRYKTVHIGDGIDAMADMSPLQDWHRLNSNFDYIRWLKIRGFKSRAFVPIGKWNKTEIGWEDIGIAEMVKLKMQTFRQKILKRIEANEMDPDAYAVATAMALGNKASLRPELREEYNISGVSHILALSGVHLSIIYCMLSFFIRRKRVWSSMIILSMIWAYTVFTGLPASVIRAALMLTILEIIELASGSQKRLNILGAAAFVMVMFNPQNIWDVGFQMSFAAVLGITTLMDPFRILMPDKWKYLKKKDLKRMTKRERWVLKLQQGAWYAITISISAQIGTIPLTIYYFGRISMYFILTNLISIPLVTTIVILTIVLSILITADIIMGISGGAVTYYLAKVTSWFATLMNCTMGWISGLPGASIEGISIDGIQAIAMYAIIIMGIVYANKKRLKEVF